MKANNFLLGIVLLVLASCDTSNSVDPVFREQFIKYYGTDGDQSGVDLLVNDDGTMILLGNSISSTGVLTTFVMKVDRVGELVWQRQVGGVSEQGVDIEFIRNGSHAGSIMVASNIGPEETSVIRLVRINQSGVSIDSTTINTNVKQVVRSVTSLQNTPGFVITGYADRSYMTEPDPVELNDNADILAYILTDDLTIAPKKLLSKGGETAGSGIRVFEMPRSSRGELLFFGYSNRPLQVEFKNNFYYDIVIEETPIGYLAGTEEDEEILSCVISTPPHLGEGFLMTGTSVTAEGASDLYIVKVNSTFNYKSIDKKISLGNRVVCVGAGNAADGHYVLLNSQESPTINNITLVKLEVDGTQQWLRTFGTRDADDTGGAVTSLPDGRIAIIGTMQLQTRKKVALILTNSNGDL